MFTDNRVVDNHASSLGPSIGGLAQSIWAHKLVVLIAIFVGIVCSIGAYASVTPVYDASTLVIVGQGSGADEFELAKRQSDLVSAGARVAESEEVMRAAVERFGLDRLGLDAPSERNQSVGKLRAWLWGRSSVEPTKASPIDDAVFRMGKSVWVSPETRSSTIKITVRHPDASVATDFANVLAQAFIERQIKLSDTPGAIDFFRIQKDRFNADVERNSTMLETFAKKQKTFSIVDQRTLLLRRSSDVAAALATTRSSLAEKQGQRTALVSQLKLLRPVTLSPFVSNLVDALGTSDRPGAPARTPAPDSERPAGSGDPPLLMVRVYQDAMVALFKVNADLKGLRELLQQQQAELDAINSDLGVLSANQTEFEKLKRDVALATFNAELYAKRTVSEQIDADLRTAKLSKIKVIQPALVPLQAAFPNGRLFVGVGTAVGVLFGLAVALLRAPRPGNASAGGETQGRETTKARESGRTGRSGQASPSRQQRRSMRRTSPTSGVAHGAQGIPSGTGPTSARKTGAGVRRSLLIALICIAVLAVITATKLHDVPAAGQIMEWARTSLAVVGANRS